MVFNAIKTITFLWVIHRARVSKTAEVVSPIMIFKRLLVIR